MAKKRSRKVKPLSEKNTDLKELIDQFNKGPLYRDDPKESLIKSLMRYALGTILIIISMIIAYNIDLNIESIASISGTLLFLGMLIVIMAGSFEAINLEMPLTIKFIVYMITLIASIIIFIAGIILINESKSAGNIQFVFGFGFTFSGLISLILIVSILISFYSLLASNDFHNPKRTKPEQELHAKFRYLDESGEVFSAFFYGEQVLSYYNIARVYLLNILVALFICILSAILSLLGIIIITIVIDFIVLGVFYALAFVQEVYSKELSRKYIFDKKSNKFAIYRLKSRTVWHVSLEMPLSEIKFIEIMHIYRARKDVIYDINIKTIDGRSMKCLSFRRLNKSRSFGTFLSEFLDVKFKYKTVKLYNR